MSIDIQFNYDSSILDKKIDSLNREVLPNAIARASNRTMLAARTLSTKKIREGYNIKSNDIKDRIEISQVFPNSTNLSSLVGSIKIKKEGISLSKFGASQTSKGVSFRVTKKRKTIKGAFIAKMKSGFVGVFVKDGDNTKSGKKSIRPLYSTSPVDVFNSDGFREEIEKFSFEKFKSLFNENFNYYSSKI